MKRIDYKAYLFRTFIAIVLMGSLAACVEYQGPNGGYGLAGKLAVKGTVSDATVVTRAVSDVALNEKQLNTLDVFVEPVEETGTIFKQYHLTATTDKPIQDQVNNLLANNWRTEGLEVGKKYNVYVAVNNPLTTSDVENVAALKGLTYNEVTLGKAVIDKETGDVTWPDDLDESGALIWSSPSGEIYKQYIDKSASSSYEESGYLWSFETEKEFMMDGIIENWTPDLSSSDQVFNVTLNRAAAKIVLNVKFDADFLESLRTDNVQISGTPRWRFYNFAFGAPVFAPTTENWQSIEVHNSATQLRSGAYAYSGDNKAFSITTYTYPCKWATADYASEAPSIVISVTYRENGANSFGYYRIPLVKSTMTTVDRNHIYLVNATIATRGSASQDDVTVTEDIEYKVLPWNDSSNSDVIENNVTSVQHYYFNVNPKVYTLRGDGDQSVTLNYSKATGTKVNWKLFTYDDNGNQTAVVDTISPEAERAWFYDASGNFTTTYNDNSGTDWSNMGVDIVQSTEGTSGSKGTITVTSKALNNKAIKYIRLRVYLDEENDQGQSLEGTYHEDIIIRHFPTDNIQNIAGSWSSYHDSNNTTEEVTMTTRSLAIANSWVEEYGVEYVTQEITTTDNISYALYSAHAGEEGYAIANAQATTNRQTFRTYVPNEAQRREANGQNNGVIGEDGYCYWGVNPSASNWYYDDYDYRTGSGYNTQYYRYNTIYRARYTHTYTYTQYSVTVSGASTGDWVDWDASDKANHSDSRTYTITYRSNRVDAGTFNAKAMNGSVMYPIVENPHTSYGSRYYSTELGNSPESLTNNHMYVIQISSTSDTYVLGRPYVNPATHQSQDNVVSPAFMIASQLGAVLPFTGTNGPTNAATHCSRYMEVAEDGTRYTGWRLPTEAEVRVITGYQYGTIGGVEIPSAYQVIVPVLTGQWYHTLSGTEVEANPNAGEGSTTKSYLRCVRDLSAAEVDRLNGFDKIQEKYR